MKIPRRLPAIALILALLMSLCCAPALAQTPDGTVLSAADASVTGEGVSFENKILPTAYDAATGTVANVGKGSTITYTVPSGINGAYDVYLTITKSLAAGSSAPFGFSLNSEPACAFPLDYQVGGDSPFAYNEDGEYDVGLLTDTGRFLVKESVELKAGDTITITGMYGCVSAALAAVAFPNVGDILLVEPGTQVATGYDNTVKEKEAADPTDPLSGLDIIWLGSSVTFGAQSGGYYSMADAIADNHAATVCEKYAINGTTLVNTGDTSYVARLRAIDPNRTPDMVIIQLSTNDATSGKPYGEMTDSFDPASFDDTTIIGAMEILISYVRATFGCPVIFYTGSYYESEEYAVMVDALLKLQEKWNIGVVDLYNNEEMTAIYDSELYHSYMSDTIHPNRKGYIEWWTPAFEAYLSAYITECRTASIADYAAQTVYFDGAMTGIEAYYIDGAHYLKIRDVAKALTDSEYAFNVTGGENHTVVISAGDAYESIGTEFSPAAAEINPVKSTWTYQLDGKVITMSSYNIGGHHFCKLSDLSRYIGFSMGYHQPDSALYLISVERPAKENEEESAIPEQYTKVQTVVFEKLGLDVLVAMDEAETMFYLSFNAFGDDQLLYGTISGEEISVAYDKTGFFTNDAPVMLNSIEEGAWCAASALNQAPDGYSKYQTVVFAKLGLNVLVLMNDAGSEFCLSFNAFGDDQLLYGTVEGEEVNVTYDKTGFFTNDAPTILDSVNPDAWQQLG